MSREDWKQSNANKVASAVPGRVGEAALFSRFQLYPAWSKPLIFIFCARSERQPFFCRSTTLHRSVFSLLLAFLLFDLTSAVTAGAAESLAPPTVSIAFAPQTIASDGTSTLTLTLANSNDLTLTGVAVSDTLVSRGNQFQLQSPPALLNSCGGTVTGATAGSTSFAISGVTLGGKQSCSLSVNVTAPAGVYTNTTSPVTSANGGTGVSASATLSVAHPYLDKTFFPSSITPGATSRLTINLYNTTYSSITGATFTDSFPAGLVLASPVNLANDCGGMVYRSGSTTPPAPGDTSITLVGGSIPKRKGSENANIPERRGTANGKCSVSVNVTTLSNVVNVIPAYALRVDGPDYNLFPAQASLQVFLGMMTAGMSFNPSSVYLGWPSRLTVTITNPNSYTVSGVAFTSDYPLGVLNHTVPGALTSCGGSITAIAGSDYFQLSGAAIAPGQSCSVSVQVAGSIAGAVTFPEFQVTGDNVAAAAVAPATITILPLPDITVLKTVQNLWDPVNGMVSPRAIPGAQMLYQLLVTNSGRSPSDANSILITSPLPARTALLLAGPPVSFTDGVPSSGLTFAWGGAASLTDDVQFSNNGGATFSYIPAPGADGADPAVTHIRITPKGAFRASDGTNHPNFSVTFKVIIN
jgi:hypothetical protein